MSTHICPNCKCQTDENEQFCCKCGTKLESVTLSCKGCEKELNTDEIRGKREKQAEPGYWWRVVIFIGCYIVVRLLVKIIRVALTAGKCVGEYN